VFFAPLSHNHIYLSPTLFASTYVLVGAVQARPSIVGFGLLLGAVLGLGSLSPAIADGRVWPIAGYVRATKGFEGRRPRTWLSATALGRQAFRTEIEALKLIIAQFEGRAP